MACDRFPADRARHGSGSAVCRDRAAPGVAPKKARPIIEELADSDDEEIVEAAEDALSMFDPELDSDPESDD